MVQNESYHTNQQKENSMKEDIWIRAPAAMRALREFTYRSSNKTSEKIQYHLAGLPEQKFNQRRIMGDMESIVRAIQTLECNGWIKITITRDMMNPVEMDIAVINKTCHDIVEGAFLDLVPLARKLHSEHPGTKYKLEFHLQTKFFDIRPTEKM